MRSLVAVALLATLSLAGCVEDEAVDSLALRGLGADGMVASHPAFDFGVNDALAESPDGVTGREVLADGTVVWYKPTHRGLPAEPAVLEALAEVTDAETAGGIAVFGPLAFLGGRGSGPLYVVDIMDPQNPKVVGVAPDVPVRDADTILYPDGRLVLITTAGGLEVFATDVTDPANPRLIGSYTSPSGNHNIAVVPGTPIVYNSGMDIIDFSNPEVPDEVGNWGGDGCHDITFFIDRDRDFYRAYCAGYANSEIWDISNPLDPDLITSIPFPRAAEMTGQELPDQRANAGVPLTFSHLTLPNHDATVLIVGDETGGGAINGCDYYQETGGETSSGPLGNLWFYNITDEKNPTLHGHVSPSFQDAVSVGVAMPDLSNPPFSLLGNTDSCTAHFGRVLEDTGFVAMGFYSAGVLLVDFRDLDNPRITHRIDQGGSIWDVWYHQGYLFTGDMARGMDVLTVN